MRKRWQWKTGELTGEFSQTKGLEKHRGKGIGLQSEVGVISILNGGVFAVLGK